MLLKRPKLKSPSILQHEINESWMNRPEKSKQTVLSLQRRVERALQKNEDFRGLASFAANRLGSNFRSQWER
jgi:hypothetical protein